MKPSQAKAIIWMVFFWSFIDAFSFLAANPTGGTVVSGSAVINSQGNTSSITQASQTAIINWQSFSIGSGEATTFLQPSSNSAILNRVLGGSISNLNGTLSANGRVFLINQNGIVIGSSGIINTASFMASTRDITNSDFLNGNLHFTGNSGGSVTNLGKITALGGDVVLLGKTVENKGTITASARAALVSADDVLLTQQNDKGTVVAVKASSSATADKTATAVTNEGTIQATTAQLIAAQGNLFALAINNTGYVKARTLVHAGGRVLLTSDSGTISNSGTLDASADMAKSNGGNILVTSGSGTTWNTATGHILAQNGREGKGGQIETSGQTVSIGGIVDAGHGGSWLIKSNSLTIDANLGATISSGLNDGSDVIGQSISGDISVNSAIIWYGPSTLFLNSYKNISVDAPITGNSGSISIQYDGNFNIGYPTPLSAKSITMINFAYGIYGYPNDPTNNPGGTVGGYVGYSGGGNGFYGVVSGPTMFLSGSADLIGLVGTIEGTISFSGLFFGSQLPNQYESRLLPYQESRPLPGTQPLYFTSTLSSDLNPSPKIGTEKNWHNLPVIASGSSY